MADQTQSYKNHARLLPAYHFVLLPLLLINFILAGVGAWRAPGLPTLWAAIMAFALMLLALLARTMALTVQDRVIRLEMRLRCREVLPPDLFGRFETLTRQQLVALRFACDAELAALVRDVLDGKLASQKEIKQRVKEWQGDFLRA